VLAHYLGALFAGWLAGSMSGKVASVRGRSRELRNIFTFSDFLIFFIFEVIKTAIFTV
jgi:hypothetical protein